MSQDYVNVTRKTFVFLMRSEPAQDGTHRRSGRFCSVFPLDTSGCSVNSSELTVSPWDGFTVNNNLVNVDRHAAVCSPDLTHSGLETVDSVTENYRKLLGHSCPPSPPPPPP